MSIMELEDSDIQFVSDGIDELIDLLGKDCVLVYPPQIQQCANCVLDPIGKKSRNIYLNGGPMPFLMGSVCPLCYGEGYKSIEISETVKMIIETKSLPYDKYNNLSAVRLPRGTITSLCYITYLPKIKTCSYMVPHTQIEGFGNTVYRLSGDVISDGNIVKGRYCTANWERM